MGSEELDAEGWKEKFLSVQTAYEELLSSTVDYEEDLNAEIEEAQRQERAAHAELARLQAKVDELGAANASQKSQFYQRIDQVELELRTARVNERELKNKVRKLEQEKDSLERQQRQLQAEVEDQSDRLQNAIEEQEFLRIKMEEGPVEELQKRRLASLERELQSKAQECLLYSQRLDEQSMQIEELNANVNEMSKSFLDGKGRNAARMAWLERENRLIVDKDRLLAEKEKALLQAQNRIAALEKSMEQKEVANDQLNDSLKLLQLARLNEMRRQTIAVRRLSSAVSVPAPLSAPAPVASSSIPTPAPASPPRLSVSVPTSAPVSVPASVPASVPTATATSPAVVPALNVNSKISFFHQLANHSPRTKIGKHVRSQSSKEPPAPSPTHRRTQTELITKPETEDETAQPQTPLSAEEDIFALKEEMWSMRRHLIHVTRALERSRLRAESDEARIAQLQASLLDEQSRSSAILQALSAAQTSLFQRAIVESEPNDLREENRLLSLQTKVLQAEITQLRRPVQQSAIVESSVPESGGQCGVLNTKDAAGWKPRYYVVNTQLQVLEFYIMTNGGAVNKRCGSVNLLGSTIITYPDQMHGQDNCFGVTPPFSRKTLILQAKSPAERDVWITALSGCVATKRGSLNSFNEGHLEFAIDGQWTKRYFVLTSNCLLMFDKASERRLLMGFDLSNGANVHDVPKQLLNTAHAFLAFTLVNAHQRMVLKATSEAERHSWISNILAVVASSNSRAKQDASMAVPIMIAACFAATGKVIFLETTSTSTVSTLMGLLQAATESQKDYLIETTWVNQPVCYQCRQEFNWKLRKHSCHNCGQSVCPACSSHSVVVFKALGKTGSTPSRVCDMCFVSVFFGQEHLPTEPMGPVQELTLSWHGEVMQPGGQLSDYGVESSCLIRVHLPNMVLSKGEPESKGEERNWRTALNSASQSFKLLKVKKRTNLAPPDHREPPSSASALNISEALLSHATSSTTHLPSSKSQIDGLWDGIDLVPPRAPSPDSPSVSTIAETTLPDSQPPLSSTTNHPAPTPSRKTTGPPPPPALPTVAPVPLPVTMPMPTLVKEGFVDQMFGNSLKANWKRRHLALFVGSIVFSAVRVPMPKFARDGSVIGTETTYLRELGSIRLTGQAGIQVSPSEGEEYGRSYVFTLATPSRTYVWSAITLEVRNQWVEVIRRLMS